jgi:hypothetical protein
MDNYGSVDGRTSRSIALLKEDLLTILHQVLSLSQGLTLSWRLRFGDYKRSLLGLVNTLRNFIVDGDELVLPVSSHRGLSSIFRGLEAC